MLSDPGSGVVVLPVYLAFSPDTDSIHSLSYSHETADPLLLPSSPEKVKSSSVEELESTSIEKASSICFIFIISKYVPPVY